MISDCFEVGTDVSSLISMALENTTDKQGENNPTKCSNFGSLD